MSELSILIPEQTVTLRDDKQVTLRPCKIIQLRKILGLVNKYVVQIATTDDAIELTKFLLQDSGEQGLNDVFAVLTSCSGKESKFFDDLYYDELALLVSKFLEMNKDFFKRIGKKINGAIEQEEKSPQPPKTGENKSAG